MNRRAALSTSASRQRDPFVALAACLLAFSAASFAYGADESPADAAERGDRAAVVAAIESGADVDASQVDGMTALHWAARHDDVELVGKLLNAGADANAANRYGVTALSLACTNGDAEIVRALLAAGADPRAKLRGGETTLMTASRTGRVDAVRALLDAGAEVDAEESYGQTALHWTAAEGHAEVVEALLAAGADYRKTLPSGFTALSFAAREGRTGVVRVLLKAGADPNEAMKPEKRPSGRAPVAGTTPLILAVENGHFETAVALLEAGADPNDQRSGATALHTLTWVRKPNRGDGLDGAPPPMGSGELTSLDFAEKLVGHGADVNARLKAGPSGRGVLGRPGATTFLLAASTADVPFLEKLLELGADATIANDDKTTPLLAAAGVGTPAPGEAAGTEPEALETLALLLNNGAEIDAVDANGETAMHGAAYKQFPNVVAFLTERGADAKVWNRPNKYGWTPAAIASGRRHGNFRPDPETAAALRAVSKANESEKSNANE